MDFESLREINKPDAVKILFIGESRPQGQTFFYNENSNLYLCTKQAFEQANLPFSIALFREYGCWLYDVCHVPVNGLPNAVRRDHIRAGLSQLISTLKELRPQYTVVVKRGDMRKIVFQSICSHGFIAGETAFNLPFPACGWQKKYQDELAEIIRRIIR